MTSATPPACVPVLRTGGGPAGDFRAISLGGRVLLPVVDVQTRLGCQFMLPRPHELPVKVGREAVGLMEFWDELEVYQVCFSAGHAGAMLARTIYEHVVPWARDNWSINALADLPNRPDLSREQAEWLIQRPDHAGVLACALRGFGLMEAAAKTGDKTLSRITTRKRVDALKAVGLLAADFTWRGASAAGTAKRKASEAAAT